MKRWAIVVQHGVVPPFVPRAGVDEPPRWLERHRRSNMCVGENDYVDIGAGPEELERELLLCLRGALQIGRGLAFAREVWRKAPHHRQTDIGMYPPEQPLGHGVTDKAVKRAGGWPGLGKAISVREETPVAAEIEVRTPGVERRVQFVAPKPTTPSVVVAANHGEPHAAAPKIRELRERGKCQPGNDRPVLKPELEEVPVDDQVVSHVGHSFEKPMESGREFRGAIAKMCIGNDDCWAVRHGRKYRRPTVDRAT